MIKKKKYVVVYIVLIFSLLNFSLTLPIFNNFSFLKFLKENKIISSLNFTPVVRDDIEHIDNINRKISELSEDGMKHVYINCSSSIINDSLIYNFDRSMGYNYDYKNYLLWVSHVDKRDGVPTQIREADIVLISSPDQLHLKNAHKDQKIISYINNVFLENKNIARSFELVYEYNFSGINLYFYEKAEYIDQKDYDEFINKGIKYIE